MREPRSIALYRSLLSLYPKAYQREYGEQMIQTLQDMLDDQQNQSERMFVWLRVAIELPFSALQENISNVGEKTMHKVTTTSNKRIRIAISSVLAVILVVTVGIKYDALLSHIYNSFYGNSLQARVIVENQRLTDPFTTLVGSTTKPKTYCSVIAQQIILAEVDCQATTHGYTKLGQTSTDKAKILASVATIEHALKVNGYHSGSNGVTFTSLVSGTYQGRDYSPDAFYQRIDGQYNCIFDTQVAYSNPAQPAISMDLSCARTFNVLGKPAHESYQSSRGLGN